MRADATATRSTTGRAVFKESLLLRRWVLLLLPLLGQLRLLNPGGRFSARHPRRGVCHEKRCELPGRCFCCWSKLASSCDDRR